MRPRSLVTLLAVYPHKLAPRPAHSHRPCLTWDALVLDLLVVGEGPAAAPPLDQVVGAHAVPRAEAVNETV